MDYTYPVPWHVTAKGKVEVCKRRTRCRHSDWKDHVEAVSRSHAIAEFERARNLAAPVTTRAFYLSITPTGEGAARTPQHVTGPRDLSNKIADHEKEHGETLDQITVLGTVQLFEGLGPIKITRTFAKRDNGGHSARWTLERVGRDGDVVKRRVNPYSLLVKGTFQDTVQAFIARDLKADEITSRDEEDLGMDFSVAGDPPGPEGVALAAERRVETLAFLHELIAAIEANAALTTHVLKRHQIATSWPSSLLTKNTAGEVGGTIDYARSGWRPEFLRNADAGEDELADIYRSVARADSLSYTSERRGVWLAGLRARASQDYSTRSITGLGQDFSVGESRSGAGAASWLMTREDASWLLAATGTRGQVVTVRMSSPAEATAQAERVFTTIFQRQNLQNKARRLGAGLTQLERFAEVEATREEAVARRVAFIHSLVTEAAAFEARTRQVGADLTAARAMAEHFAESGKVPRDFREKVAPHAI